MLLGGRLLRAVSAVIVDRGEVIAHDHDGPMATDVVSAPVRSVSVTVHCSTSVVDWNNRDRNLGSVGGYATRYRGASLPAAARHWKSGTTGTGRHRIRRLSAPGDARNLPSRCFTGG